MFLEARFYSFGKRRLEMSHTYNYVIWTSYLIPCPCSFPIWYPALSLSARNMYSFLGTWWVLCDLPKQYVHSCICDLVYAITSVIGFFSHSVQLNVHSYLQWKLRASENITCFLGCDVSPSCIFHSILSSLHRLLFIVCVFMYCPSQSSYKAERGDSFSLWVPTWWV